MKNKLFIISLISCVFMLSGCEERDVKQINIKQRGVKQKQKQNNYIVIHTKENGDVKKYESFISPRVYDSSGWIEITNKDGSLTYIKNGVVDIKEE